MGKVFTPEDIKVEAWPRPGAHALAAEDLLDALEHARYVDGAVVYGSTAMGAADIRSDVDVFICTTAGGVDQTTDLAYDLRGIFSAIRHNHHVPVEAQVIEQTALFDGRHTIDNCFLAHLNTVNSEWVTGHDPREFISQLPLSPHEILRSYVAAKQRKFANAIFQPFKPPDYYVMQRSLELPVALGRKIIGVMTALGKHVELSSEFNAELNPNLPKNTVRHVIFEFLKNRPDLQRLYEQSSILDIDYNEILETAVSGGITLGRYETELNLLNGKSVIGALELTQQLGMYALIDAENLLSD
ncbi:MAG: nucleotidyltransferase domain-containing protein [Patescibacteria group bacterium]